MRWVIVSGINLKDTSMDAPKGMRKVEVERFNGLKKSLENQSGEEVIR